MSRYTKKLESGKVLIYGTDHALGYFYEIWPIDSKIEIPEIDRCTMFGMPSNEMITVLELFGATKKHVESVKRMEPF
jgi:hypothetical protein